MDFQGTIGVNANDVLFSYADQNIDRFVEFIFNPTAGAVNCQVKLNTTWFDVALEDMGSTSPSTFVTVANDPTHLYRVSGRFDGIRFTQNGATAANVVGRMNA